MPAVYRSDMALCERIGMIISEIIVARTQPASKQLCIFGARIYKKEASSRKLLSIILYGREKHMLLELFVYITKHRAESIVTLSSVKDVLMPRTPELKYKITY